MQCPIISLPHPNIVIDPRIYSFEQMKKTRIEQKGQPVDRSKRHVSWFPQSVVGNLLISVVFFFSFCQYYCISVVFIYWQLDLISHG